MGLRLLFFFSLFFLLSSGSVAFARQSDRIGTRYGEKVSFLGTGPREWFLALSASTRLYMEHQSRDLPGVLPTALQVETQVTAWYRDRLGIYGFYGHPIEFAEMKSFGGGLKYSLARFQVSEGSYSFNRKVKLLMNAYWNTGLVLLHPLSPEEGANYQSTPMAFRTGLGLMIFPVPSTLYVDLNFSLSLVEKYVFILPSIGLGLRF
jgi:hypothetical protein